MNVTVQSSVKVDAWMRVPQKPSRVASVLAWLLEWACVLLRHAGGCGLLNRYILLFYREPDRWLIDMPNPLYPLVNRIYLASSDHRFLPVETTPQTS